MKIFSPAKLKAGLAGETATASAMVPGVSESNPADRPESFTAASEDSG